MIPSKDWIIGLFTMKSKLIQDLEETLSKHYCDLNMTEAIWEVVDDDVERYISPTKLFIDLGICHH